MSEPVPVRPKTGRYLSNVAFMRLRSLNQLVLPALGTLYFSLSEVWGLPYGKQVVGTVVAISIFIGVVLNVSSRLYNATDDKYDGSLGIVDTPDKKTYLLNLFIEPEVLDTKKQILFKVDPNATPTEDTKIAE